jgi:hypothetical protein
MTLRNLDEASPSPQDAVGEFIVAVTVHLGMNSEAHSKNPLKRVQEGLMLFL